jgi:hypothetical protein
VKFVNSEECEAQPLFVVVFETLSDNLLLPDMQGVQALDLLPVRQILRPFHDGTQVQGMHSVFCLWDSGAFGEFELVHLLMKKRRHQQKSRMLKSESISPLCDSTFPQNDALSTAAKSAANQCPFFETNTHPCGLSLSAPISS